MLKTLVSSDTPSQVGRSAVTSVSIRSFTLLALVATGLFASPRPVSGAWHAASVKPRLLYSAGSWKGWGWSHREGFLTSGGKHGDIDVAPFELHGVRDYLVEATIKAAGYRHPLNDPSVIVAGFGVMVAGSWKETSTWFFGHEQGVLGGFVRTSPCAGETCTSSLCSVPGVDVECSPSGAGLLWGPFMDDGSPLKLGGSWHVYRIAVHGQLYQVSVDGRPVTEWVSIASDRTSSDVGIWSGFYKLAIRNFRVFRLPTAHPHTSFDPVSTARQAVTWGDIGKPESNPEFLSNAKYAALRHLPVKAVLAGGRLIGFGGIWGAGHPEATSSGYPVLGIEEVGDLVTAYRTSSGAHLGFARDAVFDRRAKQARGEFSPLAITRIGEESDAFVFTAKSSVLGPVTVGVLNFRLGSHTVHLKAEGLQGLVTAEAMTTELRHLGTLVEARLAQD
jgi:hypothetical protein